MDIYDKDLNYLETLEGYTNIVVKRVYRGVETLELNIPFDVATFALLAYNRFISLGSKKTFEILYRFCDDTMIKIMAFSPAKFLERRLTYPKEGELYHDIGENPVDYDVKELIWRNLTIWAEPERKVPIIDTKSWWASDDKMSIRTKEKNLRLEIERILAKFNYGYYFELADKKLYFDTYTGADKTDLIFCLDRDNISNREYLEDGSDLITYMICKGAGENDWKLTGEAYKDVIPSGADRWEVYTEYSDTKTLAEIVDKGKADLINPEVSYLGTADGYEYEVDYDLGDRVTVIDKELSTQLTTRIIGVNEIYENNERKIELIFGNTKPKHVKFDPGSPTELYTWIRYASDVYGANMSDNPIDMPYIGITTNRTSPIASWISTDYVWSLIKGTDGKVVSIIGNNLFLYDKTGVLISEPYINLSVNAEGFTNPHYLWEEYYTESPYTWVSFSESTTVTVVHNSSTNRFINPAIKYTRIRCTVFDGVSGESCMDQITLYKVVQGVGGYTVLLDNESMSVPCSISGVPYALQNNVATIKVYKDGVLLNNSGYTIFSLITKGCTASFNDTLKTLTINSVLYGGVWAWQSGTVIALIKVNGVLIDQAAQFKYNKSRNTGQSGTISLSIPSSPPVRATITFPYPYAGVPNVNFECETANGYGVVIIELTNNHVTIDFYSGGGGPYIIRWTANGEMNWG